MKSDLAAFATSPISAAYYRGVIQNPVKWLVIHTAEGPVGPGAARALAKWSSGEREFKTSWHYGVDNVEIASCLSEDFAGKHTGSVVIDSRAIGIEMCLKVSGDWTSQIYKDTVDLTAKLVADRCKRYSIPLKALTVDELRSGQPGIISHNLARLSGLAKTTHTDPGPSFPWVWFMQRVDFYSARTIPLPKVPLPTIPKPAPPVALAATLRPGSSGRLVEDLQTLLGLRVDGDFGPLTTSAVRRVQTLAKIAVDGVAGPDTWRYLLVTIREGSTGAPVKVAQRRLGLRVDGDFGPLTASAVRKFQTVARLEHDGVIGPNTWLALLKL